VFTVKTFTTFTLALALVSFVSTGTHAAELRAGSVGWASGQAGIVVNLAPAVTGPYTAVVQPTNTAGYSTSGECTYFNVLKETANKFEVQHKTCKDGTPLALDGNVTLKWILVTQ
jgi:hypothetical protein